MDGGSAWGLRSDSCSTQDFLIWPVTCMLVDVKCEISEPLVVENPK